MVQPAGAGANFLGSNTQGQVELIATVPGAYIVELNVDDSLGLTSCVPARFNVQVAAATRFRVTLTWDTPNDTNQTDTTGSDMDLHYLYPPGSWDQAPYDIFWRNPSATWAPNSMPALTLDDVDGAGPEVVEHDAPFDPITYIVGVYYFADNGLGTSHAVVSVYVNGVLTLQTQPKEFTALTTFWRALTINGATSAVTATNEDVRLGFPATP